MMSNECLSNVLPPGSLDINGKAYARLPISKAIKKARKRWFFSLKIEFPIRPGLLLMTGASIAAIVGETGR